MSAIAQAIPLSSSIYCARSVPCAPATSLPTSAPAPACCKLFLENGNRVFGVEPNAEMRQAGEEYLRAYSNFSSVNSSAEATTLPNASVDFVTAGQAFHWFEPEKTRAEFQRILRPQGWVAAIWNFREMEAPFARA